jgi:hypothetical protein
LTAVLGTSFTIYQSIVPANSFYRVTFEIFDYVAGTLNIRLGNAGPVSANFTANGTYTVTASASGDGSFYWMGNNTFTGKIRNISIKELPGNHRFQTTSANRPVVSARVNLLTKTEQFNDAGVWTTFNSTPTSRSITFAASNISRLFCNITGPAAAVSLTARVGFSTSDAGKVITLGVWATGLDGLTTGRSPNITIPSDGVVTYTWPSVANLSNFGIINGTAGTAQTVTLASGQGADLRPTNQGVNLPAYQRVNTSTDYDSTGFPIYIKPNGSNQFMQTNSINFTATDKMTVWQGVRKLSDAALGMITELSVSVGANNGSFYLVGPSGSSQADYSFVNKGTSSAGAGSAGFAAPITNVVTGIGNISGDVVTIRVNGTQVGTNTADQGTGNYGTYPAYFYARAGTSLFFNGNDYGSIARGAASTAAQIANGEAYINSKTKAYTP